MQQRDRRQHGPIDDRPLHREPKHIEAEEEIAEQHRHQDRRDAAHKRNRWPPRRPIVPAGQGGTRRGSLRCDQQPGEIQRAELHPDEVRASASGGTAMRPQDSSRSSTRGTRVRHGTSGPGATTPLAVPATSPGTRRRRSAHRRGERRIRPLAKVEAERIADLRVACFGIRPPSSSSFICRHHYFLSSLLSSSSSSSLHYCFIITYHHHRHHHLHFTHFFS